MAMSSTTRGLPDPSRSRAVLLGVSRYDAMDDLPAVERNLGALKRLLTNSGNWGIPDEHCATVLNPVAAHDVLDAVRAAAQSATDALVFYFAGHGLLDKNGELYLGLTSVEQNRLYRAVRFDDIRREMITTARGCYAKVVILDCCFSGSAMSGAMGGEAELADFAQVDGTYLMTATAENKPAKSEPGQEYSAFTGALVNRLEQGVADGPDLLDMETLFHTVRMDLAAGGMPTPQQRSRNDGKMIALSRNRWRVHGAMPRAAQASRRPLPSLPPDYAYLARRPPAEVLAEVAALRAEGHGRTADAVLDASAVARMDQEVASLVDALRELDRLDDLQTVLTAACLRPPDEVVAVFHALTEIDLFEDADRLLAIAATGDPADIARLSAALRAARHPLDRLLDAALDHAQVEDILVDLVSALWLVGMQSEVDGLIARALPRLNGAAVLTLADELRAAGREPIAFRLYTAAVDEVAHRPPDTIAQLCRAMAVSLPGQARQLAVAAIAAADQRTVLAALVSAFRATDQADFVEWTLDRALTILPIRDVTALAAELRESGDEDAAARLCERAVKGGTAEAIYWVISDTRAAGRPVDAKRLLTYATRNVQQQTCADLIDLITASERRRVLTDLIGGAPQRASEVIALLHTRSGWSSHADDISAAMAQRTPDQIATIISRLQPEVWNGVLDAAARTWSAAQIDLVVRYHMSKQSAPIATALFTAAVHQGSPAMDEVVAAGDRTIFWVLDYLEPSRFAQLYRGLNRAGMVGIADTMLAKAVEKPASRVIRLVSALRRRGDMIEADLVFGAALARCGVRELRDFIQTLYLERDMAGVQSVLQWVVRHRIQDAVELAELLKFADMRDCAAQLVDSVAPPEPELRPAKSKRFGWPR
jgi:hypothetical protein